MLTDDFLISLRAPPNLFLFKNGWFQVISLNNRRFPVAPDGFKWFQVVTYFIKYQFIEIFAELKKP